MTGVLSFRFQHTAVQGKYITPGEWYKVGFVFFIFYFVLWVSVGALWWKAIGLI